MSAESNHDEVSANWKHIADEIQKSKEQTTSGQSLVTNIQVAVRVRPLNSKESGQKSVVKIQDSTVIMDEESEDTSEVKRRSSAGALVASSAPSTFTYDHAFDEDKTQADIFRIFGRDMVKDAILGFNCSVFAYGQTSSGKSYTMTGSDDQQGLIPRICECLFYGIDIMSAEMKSFRVQASYYEIYNEKVYDLLNPQLMPFGDTDEDNVPKRRPLNVREDKKVGVFVDGLHHAEVEDLEGANAVMSRGLRERTVQATKMNSVSSRSHAIFVLSIAQTISTEEASKLPSSPRPAKTDTSTTNKKKVPKPASKFSKFRKAQVAAKKSKEIVKPPELLAAPSQAGQLNMRSKLSLIDLAGSERAKTSGAEGGRLTESNNINLSLSTLGRCISTLVKKAKGGNKSIVIPFRDSVLTWLLRESLAGNARTRMMASVSPALANSKETLSTLRYARSAKMITTKATVVADPKEQRIMFLSNEVSRLKNELSAFQNSLSSNMSPEGSLISNGRIESGANTPDQKAWKSMENNETRGASRFTSRYDTPTQSNGLGGSFDSVSGSFDMAGGGSAGQFKPRSLAQTGAVMNELMHELEMLTSTDRKNSLELVADDLYTPQPTMDLQRVRAAWRLSNESSSNESLAPFAVISNLNADSLLTGKLLLHLNPGGVLRFGRPGCEPKQDLELETEGIAMEHALIEYMTKPVGEEEDGSESPSLTKYAVTPSPKTPQAYITPLIRKKKTNLNIGENLNLFNSSTVLNEEGEYDGSDDEDGDDNVAEVHVNGARIMEKQPLFHGDRIVFGACGYAGIFIENPKVLTTKLIQAKEEKRNNSNNNSNDKKKNGKKQKDQEKNIKEEDDIMIEAEIALSERKIDSISYTEALHEVLRASVAKANSLRKTLSLAPNHKAFQLNDPTATTTSANRFSSPDPLADRALLDSRTRSSPDRRGQEVSADLLNTHGAVRQTNFIARELGLGIVFSIVLKSDVDSRVPLSDTDLDSLLSWRNVTVNIEAVCYLPTDDVSDSDHESPQTNKLKPLTEPHHLLTCSADQFGDIADSFSEARSLLKRCARRVNNLISSSKNKSRSRLAQQALVRSDSDVKQEEEEEDSLEQVIREQREESTRNANHSNPTTSHLTEPTSPRTHLNVSEHDLEDSPLRMILSQRVDSIAEEEDGDDGDEQGAKLTERVASSLGRQEEEGILDVRKLPVGRSVSRSMNRGASVDPDGATIWSLTAPHSSVGRFDRHSFSVGRPDDELVKEGLLKEGVSHEYYEDGTVRSPSSARSNKHSLTNSSKRKPNILRRVFEALYEVEVHNNGKVSYKENSIDDQQRQFNSSSSSSSLLSGGGDQRNNSHKTLVASQVALGLCLLNMMKPTKDLKRRIRDAERFIKVHNNVFSLSPLSPSSLHASPTNLSSNKTSSNNNNSSINQTYDSFVHGIVEHIRLCIIGAVLEDVVYELTESSPTVLRAFLTRSSLSSVDERQDSNERTPTPNPSRSRNRGTPSPPLPTLQKPPLFNNPDVEVKEEVVSKEAFTQMEARAIRAEKLIEDERLRNTKLYGVYDKVQNVALNRLLGLGNSTSTSIIKSTNQATGSDNEFLLNFNEKDKLNVIESIKSIESSETIMLTLTNSMNDFKTKRLTIQEEISKIMLEMTSSLPNNETDKLDVTNDLNKQINLLKEIDINIEDILNEINLNIQIKATASEKLLSLQQPPPKQSITPSSPTTTPPPPSSSKHPASPSALSGRLSQLEAKKIVQNNPSKFVRGNGSRSPAMPPPSIDDVTSPDIRTFVGKGTRI